MGQILWVVFLLVTILVSGGKVFGQDADLITKGRKVFIEKRCYTCHTVNAEAKEIEREKEEFARAKGIEIKAGEEEEEEDQKSGGDLSDIGKTRDAKWLMVFLKDPRKYFKDEPECARKAKKKYRKRFKGTNEEFEALIAYLTSLKYEKEQDKDFKSCLKEE
ncbi:hypothetical protein HRbin37_00340 [bacterium HR37]|jgi:cbb3-type cytochrome oxidase cytochrome c subunit|nr:hypothetical protein HRbin37_00340 [bacterium HR37]